VNLVFAPPPKKPIAFESYRTLAFLGVV
jgi:hypothetical protein